MSSLTQAEISSLKERGIQLEGDIYGSRYVFSPKGLYWLINYWYQKSPKKLSFTISLLKSLAKTSPNKEWRDLNIIKCDLPAYTDSYLQLAIYLKGSPPRKLINTNAFTSVPREINLFDTSVNSLLKRGEESDVIFILNDNERSVLESGQLLSIKTVDFK